MTTTLPLAKTPTAPAATAAPCSLPALIDRARTRLAEACTLVELFDARAAAMAAYDFSVLIDARNLAKAECLLLVKRAEIRLADEFDKEKQRRRDRLRLWRSEFFPGPRLACVACGKWSEITEAHHIYPLSWQAMDNRKIADHDFAWLCPNDHTLIHQILDNIIRFEVPEFADIRTCERLVEIAVVGLMYANRIPYLYKQQPIISK